MNLSTILAVGKGLAIKREKADDNTGQTFAHLKFTDLFVKREEVTELCRQRPGWCETSFFDELGAPLGAWSLTLHETQFTVTGSIAGPGGKDKLKLTEATLEGIEVTFTKLGAVVSGQLVWKIAGDEASDAEPLLGRECLAVWVLEDGGQQDMLRDRAA